MEMSKIGTIEVWESDDFEKYILVVKEPESGNMAKFATLTMEEMNAISKIIYSNIG